MGDQNQSGGPGGLSDAAQAGYDFAAPTAEIGAEWTFSQSDDGIFLARASGGVVTMRLMGPQSVQQAPQLTAIHNPFVGDFQISVYADNNLVQSIPVHESQTLSLHALPASALLRFELVRPTGETVSQPGLLELRYSTPGAIEFSPPTPAETKAPPPSPSVPPSADYRDDITGLRAVAVIGVLLFHWKLSWFEGGFTGVDVFFTISGFLITGVIVKQHQTGSFSFWNFYARRARRLFPALFTTVLVTVAASYLIFQPILASDTAMSAVAALFSVSNILFWYEAGYFATDSDLKPLLHTWSLGVEEQFYLFWPVALVAVLSLGRRYLVPFLIAMVVVWTAVAEYVVWTNASAAFFLTPFRIGQFALGGLCWWLLSRMALPRLVSTLCAALGLAMIVLSFFLFDGKTPFPGLTSLLPCLGTALVLLAPRNPISEVALANPVSIYLGKISYSLYLVHWPVFVFTSYRLAGDVTLPWLAFIIVSTFVLSALMFHFVEEPFRRSPKFFQNWSPKKVLSASAVFAGVLSGTALGAAQISKVMSDGTQSIEARLKTLVDDRYSLFRQHCMDARPINCRVPKDEGVLLIGDSHAMDAFNAFLSAAPKLPYTFDNWPGCPPLHSSNYAVLAANHPDRSKCIEINDRRNSPAYLKKYGLVVINVLYGWYEPKMLERYLQSVRAATGAPILVFGPHLVLKRDCRKVAPIFGIEGCFVESNMQFVWRFEDGVKAAVEKANGIYISKRDVFCDGTTLQSCRMFIDGDPWTMDRHHLTRRFGEEMGAWIKARFDIRETPPYLVAKP
ncbi:MAG: acyltransferase family protein [Pseudomonadota bacterium]